MNAKLVKYRLADGCDTFRIYNITNIVVVKQLYIKDGDKHFKNFLPNRK